MSEEGEFWRDVNEARQAKRASNRDTSAQLLRDAGISFESKNMGAHLIVKAPTGFVDFWPGTGRWIVRGSSRANYGVKRLIQGITSKE